MNSGFYKDLDTNFEQACLLSEKNFSQAEILDMLNNGNIPEKQIAALKLEWVNDKTEIDALISNLTGCDGKIREAVALKINYFVNIPEIRILFDEDYADVFANATIDINANICRLVVDSVEVLIDNPVFAQKYFDKILIFIKEAFDGLDKIVFRDKKYTVNKQLFKLYWCLEGLRLFAKTMDKIQLLEILNRAVIEKEYTIREKVAQIVVASGDEIFSELKAKLSEDENYYVRTVLNASLSSKQ